MVCGARVGDEQFDVVDYAEVPFGTVITCPKCGAKNSRTDRWCGSCDADLDDVKRRDAAPSPKGPSCPRCRAVGLPGSNYCPKCGSSFNPALTEPVTLMVGPIPIPLWDREAPHQHEIIREKQVIMVRCKYCGTLNGPEAQKCSSCGAQM
jgi:ribosomal protein L40E